MNHQDSRKSAMLWWNNMPEESRQKVIDTELDKPRKHSSLTGREIEDLYRKLFPQNVPAKWQFK